MTAITFRWSELVGVPAVGSVTVTRRSYRLEPETVFVPFSRAFTVRGEAVHELDPSLPGQGYELTWKAAGSKETLQQVIVVPEPSPDGEEILAHRLAVDPSTLEPLEGEDALTAADVLVKTAEAVERVSADAERVSADAERVSADAEQARDAATKSQESALSVLPMVSESVTIAPEGGALAVDLGRAVNVATGLAGNSGPVDVTFPDVTTPDGRVNPDGLGTLLRVDAGADRLTWPGGTVVHGTPPAEGPAMASLVRVGGAVTVVWPPDVVTSTEPGVTAQIVEIEQIIGGEVELQPGGTVMHDAQPGSGRIPAVFVNPYSRPTSSKLVLTGGAIPQELFAGYDFSAYVTHRPGGLVDYYVRAYATVPPGSGPIQDGDGWLVAVHPGPPYKDARVDNALSDLRRRLPNSSLETFEDGSWGVIFQYDAGNPRFEADSWGDSVELTYDEKGNADRWEHGLVLTSKLGLPMRAMERDYASLGITLPGTFHRLSEFEAMWGVSG